MTHAYGPSALQALCGARDVYCAAYAREVTCGACKGLARRSSVTLLHDRIAPPTGRLLATKPVRKRGKR